MKNSILDRSQFIKISTLALAGTTMIPGFDKNNREEPNNRAAIDSISSMTGFYQFNLRDLKVTVLNDGYFHLSEITPPDMEPTHGLGFNADEEVRSDYFNTRLLQPGNVSLPISPVLIESGTQRILIDSGWSIPGASATAGRLNSTMSLLGIDPESIDMVLLTHAHPDHLGGLVDLETQSVIYPNAEVVLTEADFTFWTGDTAPQVMPEPHLTGMVGVLNNLNNHIRLIQAGDEVANGIWSIPSAGHTPGHICFRLESGNRSLLMLGDAIVNIHVSFERPGWHNFWDIDQDEAAQTRRRILDMAVADEMLMLGYHLPFPGIGYALKDGDSYRWYSAGSTLSR